MGLGKKRRGEDAERKGKKRKRVFGYLIRLEVL